MKIKSLKLDNIKSFRDEERVTFEDGLNILIGPNGGGKSNLQDIISVVINRYFLYAYHIDKQTGQLDRLQKNVQFENKEEEYLDKHIDREDAPQTITITLEISEQDIENIEAMKEYSDEIKAKITEYDNTTGIDGSEITNWETENLSPGDETTYTISNRTLQHDGEPENTYLEYLNRFELFLILSTEIEGLELNPTYFYFSPYRTVTPSDDQISLSQNDFYESLQSYMTSTSREESSTLNLAVNYIAEKIRKREHEGSSTDPKEIDDFQVLAESFNDLPFDWGIECISLTDNIYRLILKKEGQEFRVDQLSSGEKEIMNFLFGILALNIENGIVVIDEPELHLHPRWQSLLISLFNRLSAETGDQFIISTHSPSFIDSSTIKSVKRVYTDTDGTSRTIKVDPGEFDSERDLIDIVKAHNNEKIFFADKIVLVEGEEDRIIVETFLKHYQDILEDSKIVEVVEVSGKPNFPAYREFLENFNIAFSVIIDRDYIDDEGPKELKSVTHPNWDKIKRDVLQGCSNDSQKLVEHVDQVIERGDEEAIQDLQKLWDYIKKRLGTVSSELEDEEEEMLSEFIRENRRENRYVLSRGSIEHYAPYPGKSVNKAIDHTKEAEFGSWVENDDLSDHVLELEKISIDIISNEDAFSMSEDAIKNYRESLREKVSEGS